ncbi:unnamed protein product [Caenorhabditis angaria]|uniref:Nuclear receptor domain-containing protein n=1 Tax=Caenorhabditis angaria TaxID=860376 RepID=A0A9P1J1W2_9PELO|nr:unnamed protein product [Caenorhabditis angaria]
MLDIVSAPATQLLFYTTTNNHLNTYPQHYQFVSPQKLYPNQSSVSTTPSPSYDGSESPKSSVAVSASKERRIFDLPCAICACPATGYHYNVASCNGCKTFFRRCVLSKSVFRCIRNDSKCLVDPRQYNDGTRIKCRSCRLERCVQQGMRKEAVTSGYLGSSSDSKTSVNPSPVVSAELQSLKECYKSISRLRNSKISLDELDTDLETLLTSIDGPEKEDIENADYSNFKRDLPEWLTIDLICSIELAKQFIDFDKFSTSDKLEVLRSSCFTIAIAFQAIESYFKNQKKIIMPDGTDIVENFKSSSSDEYHQMFVSIMDPLHREQFTLEELILALQLMFYTVAIPYNLSDAGKSQLDESIQISMQNLMFYLINQKPDQKQSNVKFTSRYASIMALNETFIKISGIHKQKMREADAHRQKFRDFLIEQLVFDFRGTK